MQPALDEFILGFSSPSSSLTTVSPELTAHHDFHDADGTFGNEDISFTDPWHSLLGPEVAYPSLFQIDPYGNSEVSPLELPPPNTDDLMSQFLNDEFAC